MAGVKQIGRGTAVPKTRKRRTTKPKISVAVNQDEWLVKTLDDRLQKQPYPSRGGKFYPSVLSSPCDRYVYLAFFGRTVATPISANVRRIFDCGDYLGYRFSKYFKDMGIWVAEEQSVSLNDPPIAGRYDFLIQHEVYGKTVVELKSINDRGFKQLITDPKPDHYLQLQIYLNLLDIQHGIVLYENKNDQQVKCFEVTRSLEVWAKLLERCERIRSMVSMPGMCTGEKYCRCKEVPNGKAMDSPISSTQG